MGILNITPDSFSDGNHYFDPDKALRQALLMAKEGADILDLGAESSRPGAQTVSQEEELKRLLPVLTHIRSELSIPISIDTTKAKVARRCLMEGADIINDISALKDSGSEMAKVVREFDAGLILMHRRGNAATMQTLTSYDNLLEDITKELCESLEIAGRAGIDKDRIVIDPGLGFSKTVEQNLEIMKNLEKLQELNYPVMLGPSRKSFIGKIIEKEENEREFGTAACVFMAILKKVQILRVHSVREMKDVARMTEALT